MGRARGTLLAAEGTKVVLAEIDLEKGRRVTESTVKRSPLLSALSRESAHLHEAC
jgi:hypothetical protein